MRIQDMELKDNHLKILLILLLVVLYISSFSFWSGYLSNLNIEYFNFNLDPNLIIKAYVLSGPSIVGLCACNICLYIVYWNKQKWFTTKRYSFFTTFILPVLILVVIPGTFFYFGKIEFNNKKSWSVYNDKCITSFQDASNAYCNKFSETDKTISKTYIIINKNDLKDKISTKNLGKLTVKD